MKPILRIPDTCLTLCGVLFTLCGCEQASVPVASAPVAQVALPADQVVARVDGMAISIDEVRRQASASQNTRQALDVLIDEELLSQQARRRGFQRRFAIRRAVSQALAIALLEREYVSEFTPQSIPEDMVSRAYQLNKPRYVHPNLVRLAHIVALAPESAPPELRTKARRAARLVARKAKRTRLTDKEFMGLASQLADQTAPVELRAEKLVTRGRGHVVAPFADAAFALTRPGQITEPVATRFGYHVIYLIARKDARNVSQAEAGPEIRKKIYDDARRELLAKRLAALKEAPTVHVDEVALGRVLSQAQLGEEP